MKKTGKKLMVYLLTAAMALTLFALPVLAEETETGLPAEFEMDVKAAAEILPEATGSVGEEYLGSTEAADPETEVIEQNLDQIGQEEVSEENSGTEPEETEIPDPEMKEEPVDQPDTMELQTAGVSKGTKVTGTFDTVSGMDVATVRYYLDKDKSDYGFAEVTESKGKYTYSFAAPYDGFETITGTSLVPKSDATVIAEYYSLSKWDGAVDVTWYNETDADFYLNNPAELAGFAAIVNGSVDGGIEDYQVKGYRSHPEDRSVNRGLPDYIESTYYAETDLIAGVKGPARKGVMKHDFANRTIHIMNDMDMGGVPGDQIDHSLHDYDTEVPIDVYTKKNEYSYPNWTPIGGEYLMNNAQGSSMSISFFNGTIEGHAHYINNLYCFRWSYASVGSTAYGYSQGVGFVGDMGTLYNDDRGEEADLTVMPAIRNLGLSGYIYGRRMVGGFVGCVGGGANAAAGETAGDGIALENLVNRAYVYCTDSKGIGGIVGCSMSKGSIINCYNTGKIQMNHYDKPAGGIIGSNEEMDLFCCYNIASVASSAQAGRGIGADGGGNHYKVDNCYYKEGCSNDPNYPGYYDYNLPPSVSVNVTSMTEEEMKGGKLLEGLNTNGLAYVEGDDGYPVLYWEKHAGTGSLSVEQPQGGAISAQQTGSIANGTVVYFSNNPETGWLHRNYTLNGIPVTSNYITVNGDVVVSAYFESARAGVLKLAQNDVCDISVMKDGMIINAQGEAEVVKNYPVSAGDALYEGDMLIITAGIKKGVVPADPSLQYSATADLANPFTYEYAYTDKEPISTAVQTFTVGSEINEEAVSLTLNVVPLTTQKLWRYIGNTSWYSDKKTSFTISTAKDLAGLAKLVNDGVTFAGKTVKLGADISLKNSDGTKGTRYWDGIGTSGNPFSGTFDGQNHKITDYAGNQRGFFAYLYGTTASNRAVVKNLSIYGTATDVEGSGIVARGKFADISGCISFCKVENVVGNGASGGILGTAEKDVKITDCINYGMLEAASKAGGIVGDLSSDSSVSGCVNKGDLYCLNTGGNSIGGIAGSVSGSVTKCANYGNITAWGRSIGGIAGQSVSSQSSITDSYNAGTLSFEKSSSPNDCVGGLIGYGSYYKIANSFNYGTLNVIETPKGNLYGAIIGRDMTRNANTARNVVYLDTSCPYADMGKTLDQLVDGTGSRLSYLSGVQSAPAANFASKTGVLKTVNTNNSFVLINNRYPEISNAKNLHVHSGGEATCSAFAHCSVCGLEYGNYNPEKHLHFITKDYLAPVWTKDGYTGDTYCADCGSLAEQGSAIAADKDRRALEVVYNYNGEIVNVIRYSVGQLDALKTTGLVGYTYGVESTTAMAATEYVTIETLLAQTGQTFNTIASILVWYAGNFDTVTSETLASCNKYYDAEGNASDAPAALCIKHASLSGTLDVIAKDAELSDQLRFGYGMSPAQYESKQSLGGRRLVSPVTRVEVNLKNDPGQISELKVVTAPKYTSYHAGDLFQTEGMVIKAVYPDGSEKTVTDYEIDKADALKVTDTSVYVLYGWKAVQVPITVSAHKYDDVTSICGEKRYDGSVCGVRKEGAKPISVANATAVLAKNAYTYIGNALKPSVKISIAGLTLKEKNDYTVAYKNNKNVGTATITITGKGIFTGSKKLTFEIAPKATTLKAVAKGKKAFTVKWKKQASQTTGYQIQYSANKNFKSGNKTVTIANAKVVSKKIGKLKAKKTYYVRIRTYTKTGGKTYVSDWSKAKSVKTQ